MPHPVVVFETNMGQFEVELYLENMPVACSNFIDLCWQGYYNGTHVHRCIEHFMVQLGCPFTRRTMKTKLRKAHAFTTDPHNSQGSHFSSAANSGVHTGISNTNDAEQGCSPAGKNLMSPAHVQHDMHDMKYAHHLDERAGTGGPKPGSEFKLLTEDTVWQLRPKQKLRKIPGDVVQRSAQHGFIPDEWRLFRNKCTRISNLTGTVSMANSGEPDTAGSQFFINVADNDFLDWHNEHSQEKHAVFGRVITGLEVVLLISRVHTRTDIPIIPVQISCAWVRTKSNT